jgi:16S rRNA (adenine1518-N6/adenine1519-N6)-dimethyltransferase
MAISPKALLEQKDLRPKKSFGQNFMLDQNINRIIADAAKSLCSPGTVELIEIGAGTGSLTTHLQALGLPLHAIERDRDLVPILREQFEANLAGGQFFLHEADGVSIDYEALLSLGAQGVVVGNLPYHLTSSILIKLLHTRKIIGGVFLLQKEVADRLASKPNSKEYGFLTVMLALAFKVELVTNVNRNAFWPVPNVDSAVIRLVALDKTRSHEYDVDGLLKFVRSIFQKRRKKLSTILKPDFASGDFLAVGIDPDLRPENLAPQQFLQLFIHNENKSCLKDQK